MQFWLPNSTYGWSAGYMPQPLYYDTYPIAQWSHPQHYYGLYPVGSPGGNSYPAWSPRHSAMTGSTRRQYLASPSSDVELHRLLGGRRGSMAIWNIAKEPSGAHRISSRGTLEPIPAQILEQPATRPSVRDMRIVCDTFPWDMEIHIPLREPDKFATVGVVLECIYMAIHAPLEMDEWREKGPAFQRKIYGAMSERIRNAPPSIRAESHVLRIDYLLGKTAFMGLKPIESSGVWSLSLGRRNL